MVNHLVFPIFPPPHIHSSVGVSCRSFTVGPIVSHDALVRRSVGEMVRAETVHLAINPISFVAEEHGRSKYYSTRVSECSSSHNFVRMVYTYGIVYQMDMLFFPLSQVLQGSTRYFSVRNFRPNRLKQGNTITPLVIILPNSTSVLPP